MFFSAILLKPNFAIKIPAINPDANIDIERIVVFKGDNNQNIAILIRNIPTIVHIAPEIPTNIFLLTFGIFLANIKMKLENRIYKRKISSFNFEL